MPVSVNGEVQAFYRESGEQRWSNKTMLYRGLSAPVVFPGAVLSVMKTVMFISFRREPVKKWRVFV